MNDAQLQAFLDIADAMQTKPADWQWIGPHMSQRMFGITKERAEAYAACHGGEAKPMPPPLVWERPEPCGCASVFCMCGGAAKKPKEAK